MYDLTKPRRYTLNTNGEWHANSSSIEYLKATAGYSHAEKWEIIDNDTQKVVEQYEVSGTTLN